MEGEDAARLQHRRRLPPHRASGGATVSGTASGIASERRQAGGRAPARGRRRGGLFRGVLTGEKGPMGYLILLGGAAAVLLRLFGRSKNKVTCPELTKLLYLGSLPSPAAAAECERPQGWMNRAIDSPKLQGLPGWEDHEADMLWGTYRPSVYFGFKTRTAPAAVTAGILWHGGDSPSPQRWLRHDAREGDGVGPFGWQQHDGRSYGRQAIVDADNSIQITTSFAKPGVMPGCGKGGNTEITENAENAGVGAGYGCAAASDVRFAARVAVELISETEEEGGRSADQISSTSTSSGKISVYVYVSVDCDGAVAAEECLAAAGASSDGLSAAAREDGGILIGAESSDLRQFWLEVNPAGGGGGVAVSFAGVSEVMAADVEKAVERLHAEARRRNGSNGESNGVLLPNAVAAGSNLVLVKLTAAAPFSVDLVVRGASSRSSGSEAVAGTCAADDGSDSSGGDCSDGDSPAIMRPTPVPALPLAPEALTGWLRRGEELFLERLEATFGLGKRGFGEVDVAAAAAALSNMLGGMGHFHGASRVRGLAEGEESFPTSLFTAVPSRAFFPRGFLWDEGFHQLLISAWDPKISVDVFGHWLGTMHVHSAPPPIDAATAAAEQTLNGNETVACPGGWIPREQVLGEVSRRRVPAEFLQQDVTVANPPTLLLLAERLLDRVEACRRIERQRTARGKSRPAGGGGGGSTGGGGEGKAGDGAAVDAGAAAPAAADACADVQLMVAFLERAGPALDRWVRWLLHTQRPPGQVIPSPRQGRSKRSRRKRQAPAMGPAGVPMLGAFQWRGRNPAEDKLNPMTLASGLDDYPRASKPSPEEHHVDLICWLAMACRVMGRLQAAVTPGGKKRKRPSRVSTLGKKPAEIAWTDIPYASIAQELATGMEHLHWDEKEGGYFDVGRHVAGGAVVEEVVVRCASITPPGEEGGPPLTVDVGATQEALMDQSFSCPAAWPRLLYPLGNGRGGLLTRERVHGGSAEKVQFVRSWGYVTLFPLLLQLLNPKNLRLRRLLERLTDPEVLWSPHGLRSLSTEDVLYRRANAPGDEAYWRGPIWINVNYLALRALKFYSTHEGSSKAAAADAYRRLRENVLRTVLGEYHRTGYFWEQYDDRTGEGRRSRPFTGWTALVVLIMAEIY